MGEVLLTHDELQERLKYWQERLRLQDWIIEVNIVRGTQIEDGNVAHVHWTLSQKMASIILLDQVDYPDNLMGNRNMENDLVHELLHLHFAPINDHFGNNRRSIYSTFEEQAIESIAYGLTENTEHKLLTQGGTK